MSKMTSELLTPDNKTDWFVLDLETTGLDPHSGDLICEAAMTAVDSDLVVLASISLIITGDGQINRLQDTEFTRNMHTKSGLLNDMLDHNSHDDWIFNHESADDTLVSFIDSHSGAAKVLLIGSSIHFDRTFIKKYFPKMEDRLQYRMIDVSTIKELARKWTPRLAETVPIPANTHRALPDILDTIQELNSYMSLFNYWNEYMDEREAEKAQDIEIIDEVPSSQYCEICEKEIKIAIFKGTGVCSVICKKKRDGDPAKMSY